MKSVNYCNMLGAVDPIVYSSGTQLNNKMKLRCSDHFKVMVIATGLCFISDCLAGFREVRTWSSAKAMSVANKGQLKPWDVLLLLAGVNDLHHLNLRILYDSQHRDIAEAVNRELPQSLTSGVMMYQYDKSPASLNQMLTLTSDWTSVLLLPLCSPDNIVDVFRMIKRHRLKSHLANWLLILNEGESSLEKIVYGLEGLIHEGTRVALVARESNSSFSFFSSRAHTDGIVRLFEESKWVKSSSKKRLHHLVPLYQFLFSEKMHLYQDMKGRKMLIGVNDIFGFFGTDSPSEVEDPKELQGIDGQIIGSLSQSLNFTFRTSRPPDGAWGNPFPNGTIPGIVGMTARREVGFSISCISVTRIRETVIDYTFPYIVEPFALFSRAPKEKDRVLAILLPFTPEVWFALMAAVLFMGPLMKMQSELSSLLLRQKPIGDFQKYSFNTFRTLVVQGNRLQSKHWPQRCLFFSWYIFCLIVSSLYSGMLTAVLAIPAFETPINFLTDLPRAVEDGFIFGLLENSANEYIFKEADSGIFKETWNLFDPTHPDSYVARPETGVRRVLERKYVYFGFKFSSEVVVFQAGREKYHIGTQDIYPHGIAIICPEGVPYKKTFDKMLMWMVESGLVSKWRQNELSKVSKVGSKGDGSTKTQTITLAHLQAAFFVIILGYSMATLVLVFENGAACYGGSQHQQA